MQVELLTREQVVSIVQDVLDARDRTEQWLTVPEAAAHMKLSKKSLYRRIQDGKLPHKRIGGSLRVPASALASLESF
jgi:excisionase family DNA binding protein